MSTKIRINTPGDWRQIAQAKLKVIVDPMVFRTADVFLRGRSGLLKSPEPKQPETMWNAINSNIGALCTFFDLLILEDKLPMYDYEYTFPPDQDTGKHTLIEYCNESEEVLVDVSVGDAAYQEIKREAVALMNQLPSISDSLAHDILHEMSAFDWEWRPDLWRGELYDGPDDQRVLDAFRYGGILFSGYAQRTGCDHVLQPKRARLYLATSLGASRAEDEKVLFSELTKIANERPVGVQRTGDIPATPTFLPYLLKYDDRTPYKLLKRALKLRKSGVVQDYKHWRQEIMDDIDKGRPFAKLDNINKMAMKLAHKLKGNNKGGTKLSAKLSAKVVGVVPEIGAEAGVETEVDPSNALGWVLRNLPGYRYRKLLMRLIIAQREYIHIDKHLKLLWSQYSE